MERKIIIGSRGSDLALWQAHYTKARLEAIGCEVEIKIIKTQGDRIQHLSFDKMEGKGFFTKEIEEKLYSEEIDLAVHSHKDLPTENPPGLVIAAVSDRETPAEYMLIRKECVDETQQFLVKENAVVGTSAARRKSQLLSFRPDFQIKDIRGNVPTRIGKLRDGHFDAVVMAKAGIKRLEMDLSDLRVLELDMYEFIPAPAQGVLAWQVRESDDELRKTLHEINDGYVEETCGVERRILNQFEGGCHMPLGSRCIKEDGVLHVWTAMAEAWNKFPKRVYFTSKTTADLAEKVVKRLKDKTERKVFISRELTDSSYFKRSMENNHHQVFGKSLIKIEQSGFNKFPQTDWIFFSSKNAVRYFFDQKPEIKERTRFAVTGKGTEKALLDLGYKPTFTGKSGNIEEVGKAFRSIAKGDSVLFPQSDQSLQTVQKQLDGAADIHNLVVYQTKVLENVSIPEVDIAVLTSPSNAEGFFKAQPNYEKLVVIGSSTAAKMEELGVNDYKIACRPTEVGLAEAVFSR